MTKVPILAHEGIQHRLRRMAYELYELHFQEEELLIIGIDQRGGHVAQVVFDYLAEISPLNLTYIEVHVDRTSPEGLGIDLSVELHELTGRPLIVIDDVLYTGTTLLNVVAILLMANPKSIKTAVLIDRGHRKLPVSSDVTGLELATTIHQEVRVVIDPETKAMSAHLQ